VVRERWGEDPGEEEGPGGTAGAGAGRVERLLARIPPSVSAPGIAASLMVLCVALWANCGVRGCPDVRRLVSYQPGGATVLLDRSGERIADLSPVRHDVVPIDDLPEHLTEAFIAVEDRRFRDHSGVDPLRVGGALLANLRAGGVAQGSSTITMQLSRNLFSDRLPASERTLERKLLEARVALDVERHYSKDEILELYLNHIFFGGAAYGIDAGARRYFDRPASELTLAQSALLAALPKAPSSYDPFENPDGARERRNLVLDLMAAQGRITEEEAEQAQDASLGVRRSGRDGRSTDERVAGWFVDRVRNVLERELGDDLYHRPLVVTTTLDLDAQREAERQLERQLRWIEGGGLGRLRGPRRGEGESDSLGTDYLQGAVVVMDADSGDILALVGGRDYEDSPFDRATRARRQAGSTIKPFVFAAALADGWSPADRIEDEPLEIELDGRAWSPRNFDERFVGQVTLREALVGSRNVPTVRLARDIGPDEVADVTEEAGIEREFRRHPMIALGVVDVSPLELAAAFTPFATLGERVAPRWVLRVEDEDGRVVWESEPERRRVMDPAVAFLVTDMMSDAVALGTARRVREVGWRGPAAGKTGTTNDAADAWFAGVTPRLAATVWIGFDRRRPITDRASGGRAAAPVWGRLMASLHDERPEPWQRPDGVVELAIDPESGRAIEQGCEPEGMRLRHELFLEDGDYDTVCPTGERPGLLSRFWGWLRGVLGLDDEPEPAAEQPERPRQPGRERPEPGAPDEEPLGEEIELPPVRREILPAEPDVLIPDTTRLEDRIRGTDEGEETPLDPRADDQRPQDVQGPPGNAGPPEGSGPPAGAGPPDDAGPPAGAGPPDAAGPPEGAGPSADAGDGGSGARR